MRSRISFWIALSCWAGVAAAQTSLPPSTRGANGQEAADIAAAPPAPGERPPYERQPVKPFTVTLFGRPLELGLRYELAGERRGNFDLDAGHQHDRDVTDHELKLDARLRATDSVTLFARLIGQADRRRERSDGSDRERRSLERGETWILVDRPAALPLSLQAGRIKLFERRSWWWDEELDAVRVTYIAGNRRLDTGLARELLKLSFAAPDIEPTIKGVARWFGTASYRWAPRHSIDVFWLVARDRSGAPASGTLFAEDTEDPSDGRLTWLGLRAGGETRFASGHRLSYRADAAIVRGRETLTPFIGVADGLLRAGESGDRRVRGHAFDVGVLWTLPGAARPTVSVGLARGSGGRDDAGEVDRNFRQTGLQENKGRVAGVKRLSYYGELLDPELANLRIASLGIGGRFLNNSSAELLLHSYRQQVASTRIAGSRLSEHPEGVNRDIGNEIDLFIAMREWRNVELSLSLAQFRPGTAFAADHRDRAYAVKLTVELHF